MKNLKKLLELAKKATLSASVEILKIYEKDDFSIQTKSDSSPLTLADKVAHQKIVSILEETEFPILSEEGKTISYKERSKWDYFWIIDPLDGTKEFIKKNGEFTINIALIHDHMPILGVVYSPVLKELYWASKDGGAFKQANGNTIKIKTTKSSLTKSGLKVATSRSHMNNATKKYISTLNNPEIVPIGSSLKFLLVASGKVDIYPRFGLTMEWDTAAAHIIVIEAGGQVILEDKTTPLSYNKPDLLNPYFIVLPF